MVQNIQNVNNNNKWDVKDWWNSDYGQDNAIYTVCHDSLSCNDINNTINCKLTPLVWKSFCIVFLINTVYEMLSFYLLLSEFVNLIIKCHHNIKYLIL